MTEQSIVELVRGLGDKVVFVEVGVHRGTTLVYVAEHCDNVAAVIGIDFYQPYKDYLFSPYSVGGALASMNKLITEEKINASSQKSRIQLVVKDCVDAAEDYVDLSLDCVFLDAYMNEAQVVLHTEAWLPKIKTGGVLCGHDFESFAVKSGLEKMQLSHSSPYHDIWVHTKS
jgi:hypothetical protein